MSAFWPQFSTFWLPHNVFWGQSIKFGNKLRIRTPSLYMCPCFLQKKNYVSIRKELRKQCMTIVRIEYKFLSGPYLSRVPESPHGGSVVLHVTVDRKSVV